MKDFDKRVTKKIKADFIRLIFPLAGFRMVSSVLISSLTGFLKAVKPHGGDLVLVKSPPTVYEIFQLLGFSQFFNIKENLEEAVSFLHAYLSAAGITAGVVPLVDKTMYPPFETPVYYNPADTGI